MKVGIYTRVSTEEQATHGVSLMAQENALLEYAKNKNYKVVDVYSDEGLSATTLDRPGLQKLLEDVRQGRLDLILITKLDRLSRGVANYYKIAEVLESNNCGWKTILEDYDSTTASGKLHINIMLSVAENEAAVTKERINFVFQNKLEKGEVLSGQKIFGYNIKNKHYVINESEAEIVRYVFDNYPKHMSYVSLAKDMSNRFNQYFEWWIPKSILLRKLYTGIYTHKGTDYPNFAPEIIDLKTFNDMQNLIKSNTKISTKQRLHALSKLIKCPHDKYQTVTDCNGYTYVKCNKTHCEHWKNKTCKGVPGVQAPKLEKELLDLIIEQLNKEYESKMKNDNKNTVKNDYSSEIKKLKNKLSKLEDMYLDDMISEDKYKTRYKEYRDKLRYYTDKANSLNNGPTFSNVDEELIKLINSSNFKTSFFEMDDIKRHAFLSNIVKEIHRDFNSRYSIVFR